MAVLAEINQSMRQPGVHAAPDTLAPPEWAGHYLKVSLTIDKVDLTSPATRLFLRIRKQVDGVWVVAFATEIIGGPQFDPDSPEYEGVWVITDATPLVGHMVRGEIEITERMKVGALVELI